MNYASIYSDFIDDRRTKEGALKQSGEYHESHHITPRSFGGDDRPDNLISLTPEDHYFAHLLLAHIHGGKAWITVKAMCAGWSRKKTAWRNNRPMYGIARRKAAEQGRIAMKKVFEAGGLDHFVKPGAQNNKFNHSLFEWVNLDTGALETKTMHAMHQQYGGSRPAWTGVVTGGKKSILGWSLKGASIRIRGLKGKSFNFVNRDGSVFTGTQGEFAAHTGVSVASCTRICKYQSVTKCGWRLQGVEDRNYFLQKQDGKSPRLNSGGEYCFVRGTEERTGKVTELASAFDSTKQQLHAAIYMIRKGKVGSYKGWRLKVKAD